MNNLIPYSFGEWNAEECVTLSFALRIVLHSSVVLAAIARSVSTYRARTVHTWGVTAIASNDQGKGCVYIPYIVSASYSRL